MIDDYFREIDALIADSPVAASARITYDKRTSSIGFIRGEIYFRETRMPSRRLTRLILRPCSGK